MTDTKISALSDLGALIATADELVVVDKSDTTMAASGTNKRITKANLADRKIFNIRRYGATEGADSTTAINDAITAAASDGGGIVYVPPYVSSAYQASQLRMKTNVWLMGDGVRSRIKSVSSNPNSYMIILDAATDTDCWISDLHLYGDKATQTANGCLLFDHTGQTGDRRHRLERLYVTAFKNDGLHFTGAARAMFLGQNYVGSCDGNSYAWDANATDSSIVACQSGLPGLAGFKIGGSTNRFVGCKSFYAGQITAGSGNGYECTNNQTEMVLCEAQDNLNHGFSLNGNGYQLVGCQADTNDGDAFATNTLADSILDACFASDYAVEAYQHNNIVSFTGTCTRNSIDVQYQAGSLTGGGSAISGTSSSSSLDVRLVGATTSAYTVTNVSADRTYDANAYTMDELADVLGTLITDLKARGVIG